MLAIILVLTHVYISFISVLIHSLNLIMIHLILSLFYTLLWVFIPSAFTTLSLIFVTLPQLTFLFFRHPFKVLYKTPNKPYKGMYKFLNFDLASPSIDHSIKFSDSLWYAKGISIEVLLYICVSTFLWVIHLNVYIISTIRDIL